MIWAAIGYLALEAAAKLAWAVFGEGARSQKAARLLGVAITSWLAWVMWTTGRGEP